MSAALELKKAGHEVELFERSRLLGGKATSFEVDGVEVDNGQHVYLACCNEFIDFVHEVERLEPLPGARPGPLLYLQPRFEALLLRQGTKGLRIKAAPLPAPFHLATVLLGFHFLGLAERFRLAQALLGSRRPVRHGETMSAWLDRHHQSQAARIAFWEPFLVPALNARLEEVAAADALFVIREAFLSDAGAARFGYALVPLARIAVAAASALDHVHLRTPVAGLEVEWRGERGEIVGIRMEDGSRREFETVVLAVPPNRLTKLLGTPEHFGVHGLDRFRYAPIVDVHLWYDVPSFGFDFAAVLESPVQWVFVKGPGYLCCSLSAAEDVISMPNQELVELCHRELGRVVPELTGRTPLKGAATRDREATFVPLPGLVRPGAATTVEGLTIAGAWTETGWPATMESAVRSGRQAARLAPTVRRPEGVTVG